MSDVQTWSPVALNNNAAPPDGFPEGQAPSTVNDSAREVMAAVRRWIDTQSTVSIGSVAYPTLDSVLADVTVTTGAVIVPPGTHALDDTLDRTLKAGLVLIISKDAYIQIPAGRTFTVSGTIEAGMYKIFNCVGTGKVAGLKYAYAEWWGAVGDNTTDDNIPLQRAITQTAVSGGTLKLLGRSYYSSLGLTIPVEAVTGNNLCKFTLRGENRSFCDTTNSPDGTVIRVPAAQDGISLPVLTAPNNTLAYWAKHITISDIFIKGPGVATPTTLVNTKGFRFGGVQFLQAHNLHAEGFGYGIYVTDGSEINFTGVTMTQNNYYGLFAQRYSSAPGVGLTDMMAWFENLITVGDYIPVWLDNPRAIFIKSGENVTIGLTRTDQPRIKITNCWSDAQVHFENYAVENDEDTPSCTVDSSGVSILTFSKCNFESSYNRIVSCAGFFDLISVTSSLMDRTYMAASPRPVIELTVTGTETTGWARACKVVIEDNSPCWADGAVKNSMSSKNPYTDFMPRGYEQVNPRPEVDRNSSNYLNSPGPGVIGFTVTNKLCGLARAYWTTAEVDNGFIFTPKHPLIGATTIYITAIVDDNSGAQLPVFALTSTGASPPTDWNTIVTMPLETYTIGARTFTKYYCCIVMMKKAAIASPGIETVRIYNMWSPAEVVPADNAYSGCESFNIYVNTKEVRNTELISYERAVAPSLASEGYFAVGDIVYNSAPAAGAPYYWVCTVAGNPGTWKASANLV